MAGLDEGQACTGETADQRAEELVHWHTDDRAVEHEARDAVGVLGDRPAAAEIAA